MSRDVDVGVALYSRKVLIRSKAENILPKWLRFVKGVVDSEDIPLNLSRELLQNSALIRCKKWARCSQRKVLKNLTPGWQLCCFHLDGMGFILFKKILLK
ncbi:hypothetical protein J437_LFUL019494, partial [Ladona fulva]